MVTAMTECAILIIITGGAEENNKKTLLRFYTVTLFRKGFRVQTGIFSQSVKAELN